MCNELDPIAEVISVLVIIILYVAFVIGINWEAISFIYSKRKNKK